MRIWCGRIPICTLLAILLALVAAGCQSEQGSAALGDTSTRQRAARPTAIVRVRPGDQASMVYVAAGEFVMGSADAELAATLSECATCPDDWFDGEKPQHRVNLPAYWIDKFEVTNLQYRLFIKARGYDERKWWTELGWAWKTREQREHPQYWEDPAWNQPELPVVGVTWFEAVAYCRWAGARLPSEAEWEKAAGWDPQNGRQIRYPWGDEWRPENANTAESGLRRTTPAGETCEQGASPVGACDMSGNVWEWCSTLHQAYPYSAEDGREDLEAKGTRTLRGGSWINERHEARAAYRLPPFPGDFILFDPTNGFRCAMSE